MIWLAPMLLHESSPEQGHQPRAVGRERQVGEAAFSFCRKVGQFDGVDAPKPVIPPGVEHVLVARRG